MSEQGRPIAACPECATKVRLPANIAPGDELACTDDEEFAADGDEEPRERIMRPDERRQIVGWDEDGYAPHDSSVAEELFTTLHGQPESKFVIVRLRFPENAEISNQALIEEIVAKGWVIE